jgi:hypothetical protein
MGITCRREKCVVTEGEKRENKGGKGVGRRAEFIEN